MQRFRMLMFIPALTFVLAIGCGKGTEEPGPTAKDKGGKKGGKTAAKKEPVTVKATGKIEGRVTYDGTPPKPESLVPAMKKEGNIPASDVETCLAGDTNDPTWIIGEDKGVANVVVWVRPVGDKYFVVPEAKRNEERKVVMDQPHCRFRPAVAASFPNYFDPESKTLKETKEEFTFKNSAPILHNTNFGGGIFNPNVNEAIPKGGSLKAKFKTGAPDTAGGEDLIEIKCNVHPFMRGWARVFDHPYFAVTAGDPPVGEKPPEKFGAYTISDVPAGTELEIVYWHPSFGKEVKKLKTITVKEGATETVDIQIK